MSDHPSVHAVNTLPSGRIPVSRGRVWGVLAAGLLVSSSAFGASVVGSKHDLSTGGGGMWGSTDEDQVCVFCHTPHNASTTGPLWNRNDPAGLFNLYTSSTMQAVPNQPAGVSAACLSCHDGVIALNSLINPPDGVTPTMSGGFDQLGDVYYPSSPFGEGGPNIGGNYPANTNVNDLTNDHPVSFVFDAALVGLDPDLQLPGAGDLVTLRDGQVECTSCHAVHDPAIPGFLVKSNQESNICTTCHLK